MKVSFLVPCYNEERTIGKCIYSILNQTVKPNQVIVVNDGSTDGSEKIISSFKDIKLINLKKNTGNKSIAIEKGLKHVTGDIVFFTDADTFLEKDFIGKIMPHFNDRNVGAVAGKVVSLKKNWLTSCRELNYIIGQEIHKKGQAILGAIMIVPGCSAAFRRDALSRITMDHDTITEDMDITLKIHKLGYKIKYEPTAVVYTTDPSDIRSYVKQLLRWYLGAFQNLRKHKDLIGKRGWLGKFEIPVAVGEGLVFGTFYLFSPLIFVISPAFVIFTYLIDFTITAAAAVYGALSLKRYDLLKVVPIFYLVRAFNEIIWLYAFLIEIILKRNVMIWYRAKRDLKLKLPEKIYETTQKGGRPLLIPVKADEIEIKKPRTVPEIMDFELNLEGVKSIFSTMDRARGESLDQILTMEGDKEVKWTASVDPHAEKFASIVGEGFAEVKRQPPIFGARFKDSYMFASHMDGYTFTLASYQARFYKLVEIFTVALNKARGKLEDRRKGIGTSSFSERLIMQGEKIREFERGLAEKEKAMLREKDHALERSRSGLKEIKRERKKKEELKRQDLKKKLRLLLVEKRAVEKLLQSISNSEDAAKVLKEKIYRKKLDDIKRQIKEIRS